MLQHLVTRVLACSVLLIAAVTGTPLERRDCNHNNLLRGLLATSVQAEASAYCSSYLSIPVVTETVDTVYPYITITTTTTIDETALVTVPTTTTETCVEVRREGG
ncbi:hypothetical protein GP486_000932 [Trichoglossum hirsutum]|uniref:Uncharacterized protein n=1 Tax=Trichoglossum hirsutum TaxID=265104 RepID=A0A9P8LHU2_9PEZI|nr:hypothetical protein GP486_000932 [Trichoglossum hirsutum]